MSQPFSWKYELLISSIFFFAGLFLVDSRLWIIFLLASSRFLGKYFDHHNVPTGMAAIRAHLNEKSGGLLK